MALSYNLAYQESISVHPTRRQIFAGKTDSTFWNIWQWVVSRLGIYREEWGTYAGFIVYSLEKGILGWGVGAYKG